MADTAEAASSSIWDELMSPLNLVLISIIVYLVYKIIKSNFESDVPVTPAPRLPKLRKDMTVAELKNYDGTQPDGRVLLAVNGIIFDVTRGKRFYGPGGPYAAFAGKDATRGLATGQVAGSETEYDDCSDLGPEEIESAREWEEQFKGGPYAAFAGKDATRGLATGQVAGSETEYDDCSDLGPEEIESAREWEEQFKGKYDIVGRLLKPGETAKNYSDDESEEKKDTKAEENSQEEKKSN